MANIAFDLRNSSSQNLTSFTNNSPTFSSAGDGFGKFQRGVSTSIPFSVLDDSAVGFPADNLGIIPETNTDAFFGATDTENGDNTGAVNAVWEFDISGASNLSLSIDTGAMGDFEADDSFSWTYQIDGGTVNTAFTGSADEADSFTYTLADGDTFTLDDPMKVDGTTLSNNLQTLTTPITGTGSTLALTLTAQTNGGSEAFAFQNILIEGDTAPTPANLVISEIMYNPNSSEDDWEWVEVYNAGGSTADLSGYVIDDGNNSFQTAANIASGSIAAGETAILYNVDDVAVADFEAAWGTGINLIGVTNWGAMGLNNGGDRVSLWSNFTDYSGDEATFANVIDTVEFDDDGTVWPSDNGSASIYLTDLSADNNVGTNWALSTESGATPAGSGYMSFAAGGNSGGDVGSPGGTITNTPTPTPAKIYEIQGESHTSPLVDQLVTTLGVVTAVDDDGFYLQDATGDDNDATSDAIFVFTDSNPTVEVGNHVEVTGTVSEFFPGGESTGNLSTTQISGSPTVNVVYSVDALPAATIIGAGGRVPPSENIDDDAFASFEPETDGIDFFESIEGMRVTAQDAAAVAPTNRFGEIFTVVDNGNGATGISERGTLNISPDDFNPEKVQIDTDSDISGFDIPEVNVGAKLGDVTGVVGYSFGNFEIYPTEDFTANVVDSTIEPETTAIEGNADKLTVASYNVLNLDPNDSDGDTDVADGRFDAIASQIVNNLKTPDIIGLQEIQDNSGSGDDGVTSADQTLQDLVDAIAAAGGPTYSFIDNTFIGNNTSGGQPGGNIRTAFLYNTNRVDLVDGSVETIEGDGFAGSRLPLVAKFTFNGEEVSVVNNHFSSKGGSSPILGVEQPFEARQEEVAVNGSLDERQAQSQAVKGYVDGILEENADANVVVLGDLNEFEFVSPVETLADSLTNLTETVSEDERYSFIFQGNSQSLDHILVSDNLTDTAEFDIVHVNSEFADTDEKASDHDPLVASLSFSKENMDKINLSQIGTYTSEDGAEIVAHDPTTQRLFVTTGDTVEIIDISNPSNPTKFGEIDLSTIGTFVGGGSNSVAVYNGIVAVAVEANTAQDNGVVAFYNTDGILQNSVEVGALPDMLTFTPDGMKVIVANEGEPNDDYTVDPEGSISIVDISGGVGSATVITAGFAGFNDDLETLKADGVRIFGERAGGTDATVAEDLEPEYIAVSPDGTKAFVTLQENNAVAVLDIASATVEAIKPLGFKDYNAEGNGIDASNRDDGINIQNWPVFGMYQPDAINSFEVDGNTYYITANEGDARIRPDGDIEDADGNVITEEGDIFNEEERIKDVTLDPTAFPNAAELQEDENLGRLKITNTLGDTDGDGDFDELYSYGGRSFSIWNDKGELVFDSADAIAQITAEQVPELFNANGGDTEEFDERSDDKGAEPESVTVGMVQGKPYGFIGLERTGGVLVYDLSNPSEPEFQQYITTEGDIAPEGLEFIAADESPNGKPMLAVANEVSNTTTLYEIFDNTFSGDDGDNTITGNDTNDFIDAGAGNDTINPGTGNDIVNAGPGDDTIVGGQGDNQIDGGEGIDTVTYDGNRTDFDIERIGDQIKVGSNTDTLTNVEFLEFNDGTIDTADIKSTSTDKINLSQIGTYTSEDGAEIVAHDPTTQRLFVTTGDTVEIIDISNPSNPTKFGEIDLSTIGSFVGGGANSVAVYNGIVAVAVEANTAQDNGVVAFYNTDGVLQNSIEVGALPDMLTFTPDGMKVIVANEGEPNDDYTVDPEGSISIVDISGGVGSATVMTAGFAGFNDQKQALINKGVRIFGPNATVAQDLEPEYIAVSADGSTAIVTLQENNAIAVVDIETATVADVLPLGVKDHSKGQPTLTQYEFSNLPVLGTTATTNPEDSTQTTAGQDILLGGLSGLHYDGIAANGNLKFVTVPDRGPNGNSSDVDGDDANERPFALPDYQAQVVTFELNEATGAIENLRQIGLTRQDGTPITGLPNIPGVDEEPVDLFGNLLGYDEFGADLEGVVINPADGSYWMVDEYRPAIYNFDFTGKLINRFVPEGTGDLGGQPAGTFGSETLPAEYSSRRPNRGFEAVALDTDNGILYSFIQTPLANPDRDASDNSDVIRILGIDPATGNPVSEYVYLLEDPAVRDGGRVDKIGDAVYVGDGKFKVIERDSAVGENAKKFIFEIDLTGATNLLAADAPALMAGKTLEQHTADELVAQDINPVEKTKVTNLPSIGYQAGDKPEGLTMLPDGRLAVLNDNDFGLLDNDIPVDGTVPINPNPTPVVLGIIDFPEGNQLDASNRDGEIDIKNHPILGLYQPDAISSFEVDGKTYYITANEGDARDYDGFSEEARVGDDEIVLDPTAYPDAANLKQDENLGRLKTTTTLGDYDGDGDVDQIFSYGGRSFSIWDGVGNLVFDSGDQIAEITASQTPEFFNANNGDPDDFDSRSDDKGAEPESVTVGMVDGKPYGFIGLERAGGGVLVYDLSNPSAPVFNQYIRTEGDIAPEGLQFIAAEDSPNGKAMLAVANEVSNTTTLYDIAVSDFTLQLLHTADQEGGIPALEDAPNFSAVLNALKNEDADGDGIVDYENTLTLSSGDAYIPGIFLDASEDESLADLLGKEGKGRSDIIIQNELGFQAIALGNHEFDLGTEFIASVIAPDEAYPGANFPYLSSNLDASTDANLAPLVTPDGQEASDIAGKIAGNTIVTVNGEKIGVVGATTPTLASISSPEGVTISPENPEDIAALAAEIQASVDSLLAANPDINKVVLISHMQQIAIEEQLAGLLKNVDIIMAGGSNTLLSDSTDRLRDGDTSQGVYPIVKTDADGKPVAVVNTDGNYKYVGRLVVDFDADGNIIPASIDPNISGAYATDEAGVAAVGGTPDPEIVAITDALSEVIADLEGNFFGVTDTFLNGTRGSVRTEETNLGNLTADANLAIAKQTDSSVVISIKNGGGIRDNIGRVVTPAGSTEPEFLAPEANELAGKPEGGISEVDIKNTLRFNNGLTLLTASAEELLAIIEHGVAASGDGETPGQFPQVSGLSFSFDESLPAGDRVQSLAVVDEDGEVIDVIAKDGELQGDASRTFRLVTLSFLANDDDGDGFGGDGYPFPQGESANRVDLTLEDTDPRTGAATFAPDGSEQDALAEFLAANFSEENPFSEEDVAPELDMRIQNLEFREDTVLGDIASTPIITQEVDGTTVEAIDLTGFDAQPTVAVNYTITREAAFDNEVYFYAVDDINGSVNGVNVGDANYVEEALKQLVSPEFSTTNGDIESGNVEFNAGSIVVPVIIADGTFAEALSGAAEVYFPYLGANSDGFDHIRFNDTTNTFEFEDLANGGDQDFNDITITINSIA
ncbi:putative extracellular nuclease [Rivularia sp. PCC 7116]|uniref:choice-of-anchor I family protein n=1 Tax=Rivularia sp. PCC 7116 TaxID=373994 RepID=UPI00029F49BA|nr:choice-of-anchor I family protein [Rivularia sp. PCC 7116]AFY57726.1 putative extracellular nuclease [Rivularia sp. PCC 7116]